MLAYKFETWQDHDSIQEAFVKHRPVCMCCGGRILGEVLGVFCEECIKKIKEEIGNGK